MAHEAFGKLRYGAFFRWRERLWVKVSLTTFAQNKFNAYTVDRNAIDAETELVDEAKLVSLETGIKPEVQEHIIALHAELYCKDMRKAAL